MSSIRVILADDHRIVLEGLAQLLSLESDIDVLLRCTDGAEALIAVENAQPDVLIADLKMPGLTGLELLRRLVESRSSTRTVLLTAHITDPEIVEAVRLGVGGIILKEAAPRALVQCVREVAGGGRWLDEKAVAGAMESTLRRETGMEKLVRALTRREMDIVRMAAVGMRNREIGEKLSISEGTVKMHLHSIYEKLGISGRVELTIYARDNALL
ncbi:MAG TPA: response regulator transcription factor [Thermoanaerobaculia bacterium]|nr:response regulator transcription factor [Thermoanaerobaculia bacterium]